MSKYSENIPEDAKGTLEWMIDDISPKATLLDFGCSTGYFGKIIKNLKQAEVYGIELSDDVKQAAEVLDGVYSFDLDGDWPEPVYERTYDYLFMGDILEHLKNPSLVLEKSLKLLKKNGKLFVSTPNVAHISTRLELMLGNFTYETIGILDNTHLKYFTLNSFTNMANDTGYKITSVDYALNDYPHEIINQWLAKIGLTANGKFWKEVDSTEARAFQYKFVLKPATGKIRQTKLNLKPLPQKPQQFRDEYINNHQALAARVHELDLATQEQGAELNRLRKQLVAQQHELNKNHIYQMLKFVKRSMTKARRSPK
jgi:2-polyprenyl-3-methyl-5-hydroxy-6-metoxy-1,4-benzoquinol methylase